MIAGNPYHYVDTEYINEMADGDDEFIVQVIDIYLSTIPLNIQKLVDAAAGTDYAEIIFCTHKLRGSFNFIGGKPLIAALDKIDELCNAQTALPTIRTLANEVVTISAHITSELNDIVRHIHQDGRGD
jgi:HPt (histidine-containing phosphotransfer) domain-containing protein